MSLLPPPDSDAAAAAALQAMLRYIESATPLGLWDWDTTSGRLQWSPGLLQLYGLPPGESMRHFDEFMRFVHPADAERARREAEAGIASGQPFELEFRIRRGDGSVRRLSARASPRFGPDGSLQGVTGLNLDVTEMRGREQALRLRDQIIDNMAEGVMLCDEPTRHIVFANPRFEAMLGYGPGEMVGLPVSAINSPAEAHPEETVRAILAELQASGRWRGVVRNRSKEGRDIWTRASVSAFQHHELGPVWLNVQSDVTEEYEARQARDRATAEFNRLASRMQQAIEAERAALARDVHDQLGAAFTAMRMRLSALMARHEGDPALQGELRALSDMAQAASVQTRDISSRLRPPALDDLGLVETCRWYLREWAANAGLPVSRRLRRLVPEPPPALAIDVFRVLQELLTNVARHAQATRADVSLGERAGLLVLRVGDDGRGFPSRGSDRGLGLVGVRERAQRHGGSLRIEPGPGGTRVTVTFPLRGDAACID